MLLISRIAEASPALKLAYTTVGALTLAGGGWARTVFYQVSDGELSPPSVFGEFAAAGALTATAAALVWVVRQIVTGALVHRDVTDLAKIAEAHSKALELVAQLVREGHDREKTFVQVISGSPRSDG